MKRHWLIRYNSKDEYVMIKDGKGTQLEQVIKHCVLNRYALNDVLVLETATVPCCRKLVEFIQEFFNKLK